MPVGLWHFAESLHDEVHSVGRAPGIDLASQALLNVGSRPVSAQLTSFLQCKGLQPLYIVASTKLSRQPTSFIDSTPHTPGVDCNFEEFKLCDGKPCQQLPKEYIDRSPPHSQNLTAYYKAQIPSVAEPKWLNYWWPGRAGKGECNDIRNRNRGCWYKARLTAPPRLNTPYAKDCTAKEHCLAVVAHDGEREHRLTCPSWIRDPDGNRCKVPDGWQACPERFTLKRFKHGPESSLWRGPVFEVSLSKKMTSSALMAASLGSWMGGSAPVFEWTAPPMQNADHEAAAVVDDTASLLSTNVAEQFFTAVHTRCDDSAHPLNKQCIGMFNPSKKEDIEDLKHIGMYFDLSLNEWYRCTPWLRCEKYPIKEIYDPKLTNGMCGKAPCREDEDCFVPEDFGGTKAIQQQCMASWNTFVFSDSHGILAES